MELHQLEYVVAVAKFHSFTKAAFEINTTQPLLSQQIKKLEGELGVQLFDRTTRTVELTSAGKAFLIHAQKVLLEINQSKNTVREYLNVARGHIKLGVLPVIGHYRITSLIANFQKQFPGVRMEFTEGECQELLQLLSESKINAAIISEINTTLPVNSYSLIKDHLVLVTSLLHPLTNEHLVDIGKLAHDKFIIANPNSGLYENFLKVCKEAGFEPDILYHCNQVETTLEFVREGLGVTVLSSKVASRYPSHGVSIININPEIPRRISLFTLKDVHPEPALSVFIKFALDWSNKHKSN